MITSADIFHGKILIVDDQEPNVMLLEQMLRGAGYQCVSSTTNPGEVGALHLENHYDLILLDLQMPGIDGFQVMEILKKVEARGYLPVLVITAQPDHKLRALNAGAKDFVSKPFNLAEVLIRVYNMLEVRLLHEETTRLYEQVLAEQKVSERLLLNVLPEAIAQRLKGRPELGTGTFNEVIADSFEDATVVFADIVGFTRFSEGVSPEILVEVLNDIFSSFDRIADARGLEKIKTIGDAYMAVAGVPTPTPDHAQRAAHMALDMLEAVEALNARGPYSMAVRIGISSGPVVAGVIGRRKFFYDVWGDTVNTASRMESHGVAGRIALTDSTRAKLGDTFALEARGAIAVKGKGNMNSWFLNGRSACASSSTEGRALSSATPEHALIET